MSEQLKSPRRALSELPAPVSHAAAAGRERLRRGTVTIGSN